MMTLYLHFADRFIRAQVTDEASKGVQGERPKLRRNDMRAW